MSLKPTDRLASMHGLQKELAWFDRKHDQLAAIGEKRRWKAIQKSVEVVQSG